MELYLHFSRGSFTIFNPSRDHSALLAATPFFSRFSAHAEPRAIRLTLAYPIEDAVKKGYRGIGRGVEFNRLNDYTHHLFFDFTIRLIFFYIAGELNPADSLSRNFGADIREGDVSVRFPVDFGIPPLVSTACPLGAKRQLDH
eukprot:gene9828-6901_t